MPQRQIFLSGSGRMGAAVAALVEAGTAPGWGLCTDLDSADVVVDYSHPDWTGPLVQRLLRRPRPLLCGTTALPDRIVEDLRTLSLNAPVLLAPNTGLGVQALRMLVRAAVRALGPGWDIEVVELHHGRKVDAPSGTAWALLEDAARARAGAELTTADARAHVVTARSGQVGARTSTEIGVAAIRGGDVVGEHTVYLIGHGERIELSHRAWDRSTFARGGLRCARWLGEPGRAPGWYDVGAVLADAEPG